MKGTVARPGFTKFDCLNNISTRHTWSVRVGEGGVGREKGRRGGGEKGLCEETARSEN